MTKKQEEALRKFIIGQLRRVSLKWWARNEALSRARVARGFYKCAATGEIFHRSEIHLDHIIPVIDENIGWVSYDEYIKRLFCMPEGFQVLSKKAHEKKTLKENAVRNKLLTNNNNDAIIENKLNPTKKTTKKKKSKKRK